MNVPLVFFAAPVGAPTPEGIQQNLRIATLWLAYLLDREPDYDITAPWLGTLLSGVERDDVPAQRARGLRCTTAIASRCDGIVLCGGRITVGMQRELDAVLEQGGWVSDLTHLGVVLPSQFSQPPINYGRHAWLVRQEFPR